MESDDLEIAVPKQEDEKKLIENAYKALEKLLSLKSKLENHSLNMKPADFVLPQENMEELGKFVCQYGSQLYFPGYNNFIHDEDSEDEEEDSENEDGEEGSESESEEDDYYMTKLSKAEKKAKLD